MINRDWLNLIGTEFSTMTFGTRKSSFNASQRLSPGLYIGDPSSLWNHRNESKDRI